MAKEKRVHTVHETTGNPIYNNQGEIDVNVVMHYDEYEEGDCEITEQTSEHFEAADGTLISPTDLMRPSPETRLRKCPICAGRGWWPFGNHSKKGIPYVRAATMAKCYRCSRTVCEHHYRVSEVDGRTRCTQCHQLHRFIAPLFFKYV